jgi:hypothetical protein
MAKSFVFRNVILNALHCKIRSSNNVKIYSLPFAKFWQFYVSILLEVYILINIPKIHDTYTKYNCDHKYISLTIYMNETKHNFMLSNQPVLQCNILAMTLANRSRR